MNAEGIRQRRTGSYVHRLFELAPRLIRRAARRKNLVFHVIRTLDRSEQFFIDYYETPLIRASERVVMWWNRSK